eukprot:16446743-Heterocapsa_arctica.AAC.1
MRKLVRVRKEVHVRIREVPRYELDRRRALEEAQVPLHVVGWRRRRAVEESRNASNGVVDPREHRPLWDMGTSVRATPAKVHDQAQLARPVLPLLDEKRHLGDGAVWPPPKRVMLGDADAEVTSEHPLDLAVGVGPVLRDGLVVRQPGHDRLLEGDVWRVAVRSVRWREDPASRDRPLDAQGNALHNPGTELARDSLGVPCPREPGVEERGLDRGRGAPLRARSEFGPCREVRPER